MVARQSLLKEKIGSLLKQAASVATQLQAAEQRDKTPHFDQIEFPAHASGQVWVLLGSDLC